MITADAAGAVKGIKAVDGSVDNLGRSAKTAKPKLKSMFAQIAIGAGVALAARAAIKGMVRFMGDAISAATEQERVEKALNAVLESTGHAAGLSADELKKLARELQGVTTYGDEAIIAGNNLLLTFKNIGEDVFPRASESMLNISTAMGIDLKSSAIQVGKALNDPITGLTMLTRIGITFTDSQKEMILELAKSGDLMGAQGIILTELESQFGGAARAAAETFGGSLAQLKNVFGDLKEGIGTAITESEDFNQLIQDAKEYIEDLIESGKIAEWAEDAAEGIGWIITAIGDLAYALEGLKSGGFIGYIGALSDQILGLDDVAKNLEKEGRAAVVAFRKSLEVLTPTIEDLRVEIEKGPESWKAYTDEMSRQDAILVSLNALDKEHADMVADIKKELEDATEEEDNFNVAIETQITLLDTWMPKARNMKDWAEDMATTLGKTTIPAMRDLSGVVYNMQTEFKDAYDYGVNYFETETAGSMVRTETAWGTFTDGLRTAWSQDYGAMVAQMLKLPDDIHPIFHSIIGQFSDMIGAMMAKWTVDFITPFISSTADAAETVVGSVGDVKDAALNLAKGFSPGGLIATAIGTAVGTFLGSLLSGGGAGARDTQLIKDNTWNINQNLLNLHNALMGQLDAIKTTLWHQSDMMSGKSASVLGASAGIPDVASESRGGGGSPAISFNPTMSLKLKPIHIHLTSILEIDGKVAARAIGQHTVSLSKKGVFKIHERGIVSR